MRKVVEKEGGRGMREEGVKSLVREDGDKKIRENEAY